MQVYQAMAREVSRFHRCKDAESSSKAYAQFAPEALDNIRQMESDFFPSGSGFDSGCMVLIEESTGEEITVSADFHHMDDNGFYCGWSSHKVIIRPSLEFGYSLRITGKDKRGIKEYIGDTFAELLTREV